MFGIGQDIKYNLIVEDETGERLIVDMWLDWKYDGSLEDYIENHILAIDPEFEIHKIVKLEEI